MDAKATLVRGALERMAPILMTALAAGLALIPIALGTGKPGSESRAPMALVILFGLLSSTLLHRFVVPGGDSEVHEASTVKVDDNWDRQCGRNLTSSSGPNLEALGGVLPEPGAGPLVAVLVANSLKLTDTRKNKGRPQTLSSRPFTCCGVFPRYASKALLISRL